MINSYKIKYSKDSLDDLRLIYTYILYELSSPQNASDQIRRISEEINSLNVLPSRCQIVKWEPWHSLKMHQLLVDNFIIYYLFENSEIMIVRIFYAKRNIKQIINSGK